MKRRLLCSLMLMFIALTAAPALADLGPTEPGPASRPVSVPPGPAFLGPGGILPPGTVALVAKADGELSFFPSLFVGWRVGIGGHVDLGLEAGGLHTAAVGRLHVKARLWESMDHRWFLGLRLRAEVKRHEQDFGDAFDIDDWGVTLIPELSVGLRLGQTLRHAVYYAAYYYYDIDFRSDRGVEHYLMPVMLGYEHRLRGGFHLGGDVGLLMQLFKAETAGDVFPRMRVFAAYVF